MKIVPKEMTRLWPVPEHECDEREGYECDCPVAESRLDQKMVEERQRRLARMQRPWWRRWRC